MLIAHSVSHTPYPNAKLPLSTVPASSLQTRSRGSCSWPLLREQSVRPPVLSDGRAMYTASYFTLQYEHHLSDCAEILSQDCDCSHSSALYKAEEYGTSYAVDVDAAILYEVDLNRTRIIPIIYGRTHLARLSSRAPPEGKSHPTRCPQAMQAEESNELLDLGLWLPKMKTLSFLEKKQQVHAPTPSFLL